MAFSRTRACVRRLLCSGWPSTRTPYLGRLKDPLKEKRYQTISRFGEGIREYQKVSMFRSENSSNPHTPRISNRSEHCTCLKDVDTGYRQTALFDRVVWCEKNSKHLFPVGGLFFLFGRSWVFGCVSWNFAICKPCSWGFWSEAAMAILETPAKVIARCPEARESDCGVKRNQTCSSISRAFTSFHKYLQCLQVVTTHKCTGLFVCELFYAAEFS